MPEFDELAIPWTIRRSSGRNAIFESYAAWMHLLSKESPWDAVCIPQLILSPYHRVDWDSIKELLRDVALQDLLDEAAILAAIAILDAWCEALLYKAWERPTEAIDLAVCSCIKFCMKSIEDCFQSYCIIATDTIPVRYQVRLLLHRRDFRLWQLVNRDEDAFPLRTNCVDADETSLWTLLAIAEKAEDFRVQYQCLGWLSLELDRSTMASLMERGFDLWKLSTNTPSYLSMLDNWLKHVSILRSQRSTDQPSSDFFSRLRYEMNSNAVGSAVNFIRDEITLFSVMQLIAFEFHPPLGPRSSQIYDVREVANSSHSGTMAIGSTSAGVQQLIRKVHCGNGVYWGNTHGLTDLLVTQSHAQPHKDPSTGRTFTIQAIKRSVVFKLTAVFLPPAAIVALKLTSRLNFETIEYSSNASFDPCARFAIRRHLEESQEAPLRYRCAYCKALYPASMFEQLATLDDGGIGRVCKWHSGRYDRVIGGMAPVVKSIEKVCMHCGKVQAWEPCRCNCETCWYKDLSCTTTYVDERHLKREGAAGALRDLHSTDVQGSATRTTSDKSAQAPRKGQLEPPPTYSLVGFP